MRHVPFVVLCAVLVGGCLSGAGSGSDQLPVTCVDESDCAGGFVCQNGQCREICDDASTCDASEVCDGGVCVGRPPCQDDDDCDAGFTCVQQACVASSGEPTITAIDGTGLGDGDPTHTAHHLVDRVVVQGTHLSGAEVTLRAAVPGAPAIALAVCAASSDTEITVQLPSSVQPGEHTLTVANQAGACSATLQLLQGEPGSGGGGLPSNMETVVAIGSSAPADRSILVGGVEQVTDTALPGIYLVVIDLATHAVVDEEVLAPVRTKYFFEADNSPLAWGLRQVLLSLDESRAVILASAGDITSIIQDGPADLGTLLREFGATSSFDTLPPGDGYVLIGVRGIGAGAGIERSSGGAAPVSTLLLEQGVLGVRRRAPLLDEDIADGADIAPEKIFGTAWTAQNDGSGTGLDADLVRGRAPTVTLYSCQTSCSPAGWNGCTCTANGSVSSSSTITCSGYSYTNWPDYACTTPNNATCPCPTLMGYLLTP